MNYRLAVLLAAALLAGCGSEKSGTFETDGGTKGSYSVDHSDGSVTATIEGESGTATVRSGADVPVALPSGFTIYPGAKVVTNTVFDQGGEQGALVTMEAEANAEEMIEFYRKQADRAGMEIELNLTTDTMQMIGGKSPEGAPFSFTATREGEKTTGQLMVGASSGG